jgi:two-component system CheB/CheR fusion protein
MKHRGPDKGEEFARDQKDTAHQNLAGGADVTVPVVGIGASAGGLEALTGLFAGMPADSGMAFIVIQHLEPSHESRTAEILAKHTAMPVVEAKDGVSVQANHVYSNPSDKYVALQNERLMLSDPVKHEGIRKPIDFLLSSLAEGRHEKAVGIILSGSSGSDGLRGVRAIRMAGGICMAQDPRSAGFPEMPQSVIAAGLADYVLPVEQMPQALLKYVRNVLFQPRAEDETPSEATADVLASILDLLRLGTRSDFRYYKKATVVRRIRRRMALKQIADMATYLKLLHEDPAELTQLSRDMLIGVSAFFRDPEAFEELRHEVIVPLAAARGLEAPLRAWVAGSATGEEAYSVAMLLLEAADDAGKGCPVQVFASDVDEQALETARAGIYPASIAEDVSPERLKRFFTQQGDRWRVNKQLREVIVFSHHNLLTDPPFSRLDLVSCRNVLIYLEPAAQKKVLTVFSFALNQGGCLFLGKAEGVAGLEEDLFGKVSRQKRIFRLLRANRRTGVEFPVYSGGRPVELVPPTRSDALNHALAAAKQEAILQHFRSSIVLTDPKGHILYSDGQTEKHLAFPKGPASLNLLDLTEGLLSAKLRRAMKTAVQKNQSVSITSVPMPHRNSALVNLTITPVASPALGGKVLAVIFEDAPSAPRPAAAVLSAEDESLVAQLEAEVKALRNELRSDAEEYSTSSEALNAANEEITSMNEELQSANEELEASKEELQALNEELTSANGQLHEKVAELNAVITERRRAEGLTQARLRMLVAANAPAMSLDDTLQMLLDEIELQTGSVIGFYHFVEADQETLSLQNWSTNTLRNMCTAEGKGRHYAVSDAGVWAECVRERRPVMHNDYASLPNRKGLPAGHAPVVREMIVPILRGGRIVAIIGVGNKPTDYSATDADTVSQLGDFSWEIVERKRAEKALRELNETLEERVAERTAEVRQQADQLRALASELSQTEQLERKRLATILHDHIQQLLVAARMQMEWLKRDSNPQRHQATAQSVDSILKEALEASRSLTVELSPPALHTGGLIGGLNWLAARMLEKQQFTVRLRSDNNAEPATEQTRFLLFDCARELLFNAVKHSGVSEAQVTLLRTRDGQIKMIINDEGKGFDFDVVKKRRLSEATFGLFSIQQRLAQIGGEMEIATAPDKGTRITLTIAAGSAQPDLKETDEAAPKEAEASKVIVRDKTATHCVLIVDDHKIMREGLAGLLQFEQDIEVVGQAADGLAAIELAGKLQPDIIIMDINLGDGMNGVEATKRILAENPNIKVIGLSMHTDTDMATALRDAGAVAYLTKGGPSEDLIAAIRAACSG